MQLSSPLKQPDTDVSESSHPATAGQPSAHQFALLGTRRFLPLFLTQFLGAFNDNLYKTALSVVIVYGLSTANANLLTNLAAGLFILPFFIFSAAGGQLADRYDKSTIIRYTKVAEIGIMLFGVYAWSTGNTVGLFAALLLMGTQSAFFGPSKYAILPVHLRDTELVGGNAQLETSTFAAILLGTLVGGALAASDRRDLVGLTCVIVALAGLITSWWIPNAPSRAQQLSIDWNPLRASRAIFRQARDHHYSVLLSIMGISWFWLLGSAYLTQLPNYAASVLHGSPAVGLVQAHGCDDAARSRHHILTLRVPHHLQHHLFKPPLHPMRVTYCSCCCPPPQNSTHANNSPTSTAAHTTPHHTPLPPRLPATALVLSSPMTRILDF